MAVVDSPDRSIKRPSFVASEAAIRDDRIKHVINFAKLQRSDA
jgi:hypothetical protein